MKVDTLILGAGFSGLSLGYIFQKNSFVDYLILEKESKPGGLCRSFKFLGTYYDIGAHALHKATYEKSKLLQEIIRKEEIYCQQRKAFVFLFGKVIPHPIQCHMYYLPFRKRVRGLLSFLISKHNRSKTTLKKWLESTLGKYICEIFLFPYNEKVWQINLNKISTEWTERILSKPVRVLLGTFFPGVKNYSSNEFVCYPCQGGFGRLLDKLIVVNKNKIHLNSEVTSIDLKSKTLILKNRQKYYFKKLISTIPLDIFFVSISDPKNQKIFKLSENLHKVSICLVTFIIRKVKTDIQRVYIPEKKYFAQRVIINSNSSPSLKNHKYSVVSLEISYLKMEHVKSRKTIVENSKKLLADLKLVNTKDDFIKTRIEYFKHAYPVQTPNKNLILRQIRKYLKIYQCYTLGRFGSWDYSNIDGIILNSQKLATKLLKFSSSRKFDTIS